MKKIFLLISLLSIVFVSINSVSKSNDSEFDIDGVWTVVDKVPDMIKLLQLQNTIDKNSTFCINMNLKKKEAGIYFYNYPRAYVVELSKISINEYQLKLKNRKLKFNVNSRIQSDGNKVVHLGIYSYNSKLNYTEHGRIYCLDDIQDLHEEKCGDRKQEVEMCLKSAKESDDYFKRDEKIPY